MRKGAVETKKHKYEKAIMFLLCFLLVVSLPFAALAAGNGYHHVDWEPYFCLQAYDVTMSAKEAHEFSKRGELEKEIEARSNALIRVWGTFEPYERGFERIDLGDMAGRQEPGEYPVVMYLFADDLESNYIDIKVTLTEPRPEPEPEPTPEPTPGPTQGMVPIQPMEPAETTGPNQPEPETVQETAQAGNEPERTPARAQTSSSTGEPEAEPSPTAPPAQEFTPVAAASSEPEPEQTPGPGEPENPETGEPENELTPLAIGLFCASGAAGVLFFLSILKDLGSIRWYNSKRKK